MYINQGEGEKKKTTSPTLKTQATIQRVFGIVYVCSVSRNMLQ